MLTTELPNQALYPEGLSTCVNNNKGKWVLTALTMIWPVYNQEQGKADGYCQILYKRRTILNLWESLWSDHAFFYNHSCLWFLQYSLLWWHMVPWQPYMALEHDRSLTSLHKNHWHPPCDISSLDILPLTSAPMACPISYPNRLIPILLTFSLLVFLTDVIYCTYLILQL